MKQKKIKKKKFKNKKQYNYVMKRLMCTNNKTCDCQSQSVCNQPIFDNNKKRACVIFFQVLYPFRQDKKIKT